MLECINWGTFWSATGALATVAGAVAVIYAGRQLKLQAWLNAQEIWTDPCFTSERGEIFSRVGTSPKPWTEKEKETGLNVCRKIEKFARLSPYLGFCPHHGERMLLDEWGDTLAKAWAILEPLVIEERKKTGQPQKWNAFQKLGEMALLTRKHLKQVSAEPGPAHDCTSQR